MNLTDALKVSEVEQKLSGRNLRNKGARLTLGKKSVVTFDGSIFYMDSCSPQQTSRFLLTELFKDNKHLKSYINSDRWEPLEV